MTKKTKRTQKTVLAALRDYRSTLLEEYLLECKSLFNQMSPLFESGYDETGHVCLAESNDIPEGFITVEISAIDKTKKVLTEILSGYWKKDANKLFEILDVNTDTYPLICQYVDSFAQLSRIKSIYDTAGKHLSQYLGLE